MKRRKKRSTDHKDKGYVKEQWSILFYNNTKLRNTPTEVQFVLKKKKKSGTVLIGGL